MRFIIGIWMMLFSMLMTFTSVQGQINRYNETWMFGNYAGLSFSGLSTGAILGSVMSSPEGVATISDNGSGDLLFYSNGQRVWGFNHKIIKDGDFLNGDANSTQSALFVPVPKSNSHSYLFTTDAEGGSKGLCYSQIDKNLDTNGGIIAGEKNILLATPVTEKLALLRHCDRQSYWVVAHDWGSDKFLSWRIKENGFDKTPVETATGPIYAGAVENGIGYMRASPEDDILALAVTGEDRVDLFHFDNITGEPEFWFSITGVYQPYGIEFSDDQAMMYVSSLTGYVYQYNMQAGNIQASRVQVAYSPRLTGALQMAPDGRIYIARDLDPYLGYIGAPNSPGSSCLYVDQGVFLSGRISEAGLPPKIPLLEFNNLAYYTICLGDTVTYNPQFLHRADSFIFYFGDPLAGPLDTTTQLPAKHLYQNAGTYPVQLFYYMCGEEYLLKAEVCVSGVPVVSLGNDTAICANTTFYLQGILNNVYCHNLQTSFHWSTGQTTQSITISPPGYYIINVDNICGSDSDTITITELPVPTISLGPDIQLCAGDTAVLAASPVPDSIVWNDGVTDYLRYVTTSGYYSATVVNEYNCVASDGVEVFFLNPPLIGWDLSDTTICIGHPMELDAGSGFDSYFWHDGSSGTTFLVTDSGWYYVTVANMCGSNTDSMYVHLEDCNLKLYVPNAFTPDGDGLNDIFLAAGIYMEDLTMWIFNRFGECVFYTEEIDQGWDGFYRDIPAPEGVYVWKIHYLDATGKYHDRFGTVTLLRK